MLPGDIRVTSWLSNSSPQHYCLILSNTTDDRLLCVIVTSRHFVLAVVSSCDVKRFYKLGLDWH
jgi:hypothetical protein